MGHLLAAGDARRLASLTSPSDYFPGMTQTVLGTVKELARYPVKSLLGERCDGVRVDGLGVEFDRAMAIYGRDGRIASGKTTRRFRRMPNLFHMRSWVEDGTIYVETPGGKYPAGDPSGWKAVSEAVGEPVEIRPETDVSHKDDAPIHLITTASLRWVEALRPSFDDASERFRPNVVVEVTGVGRVEDAWIGSRLQLGTSLLRVTKRVERCVMPTLTQGSRPFLPSLLKVLTERSDACLGVYAEVEQPGHVVIGDRVTMVESP